MSNLPYGTKTPFGTAAGGPTSDLAGEVYALALAQALDPLPVLQYTPTSSSDPVGQVGQLAFDSNFLYVKTATGWMRTALGSFAPPPTFNPSAISGLQLWLRADLGVTNTAGGVSSWLDQSPLFHDVTEPTNKGTFAAASAAFNNQSTITFTGLQRLVSGPWAGPLSAPFTMVIIGKQASAGTGLYAIDADVVAATSAFFNSDSVGGTVTAGCPAHSASIATNPATPAIYVMTFNGAASNMRVSAHTQSGTNFNTVSSQVTGTTIGNKAGGAADAGWEIAELVIYNRGLFPGEVDQLNAYANARYGIAIGP